MNGLTVEMSRKSAGSENCIGFLISIWNYKELEAIGCGNCRKIIRYDG